MVCESPLPDSLFTCPRIIRMPLHSFEVLVKGSRGCFDLVQVLPAQSLAPVLRELSCCKQRVPNLSAIHLFPGQFVKALFELRYIGLLSRLLYHCQEVAPYGFARLPTQVVVVYRDLDTGLEGFVESTYAV